MAGIEGAGLVEQPGGLGGVARLQRLPRRGQELEDEGLGLHPLLRDAEDALELRVARHRRLIALHGGHQLREPALIGQRLQLGAQGDGTAAALVGQCVGEIEAQAREVRERVEDRHGRRAVEVVHADRTGGGAESLLKQVSGLELWVHPQHEVTAEESLLAIPFAGQIQRLVEGAEDPLLDVGRKSRITGVAHLWRSL